MQLRCRPICSIFCLVQALRPLVQRHLSAGWPDDTARLQRQLLRQYVSSHGVKTDHARQFVATVETLLALTRGCARKPPLTFRTKGKRVDKDRIQEFCRYCGSPTELAAYADGRLESDPDETLQFSSQYCSLHRPKLPDGGWNPEHQRAAAQFDAELERSSPG